MILALELSISADMIWWSWTADTELVQHVSPVPKCWETMAWLDSWRRLGPRNRSLNCIRESLLRKFSLLRNFLRVQFVIIPRESFGGSSSSYSKVSEPGEKWAPSESCPPSSLPPQETMWNNLPVVARMHRYQNYISILKSYHRGPRVLHFHQAPRTPLYKLAPLHLQLIR